MEDRQSDRQRTSLVANVHRWIAAPAIVLLFAGVVACATTKIAARHTSVGGRASATDFDRDGDNDTNIRLDADGKEIMRFGRQAEPSAQREISSAVRRYFAAALRADGRSACPIIYSLTADEFVEERGRQDLSSGHVNSCAVAMSKLFSSQRESFAHTAKSLAKIDARVAGDEGIAFYDLAGSLPRYMYLERERGKWKIKHLWDQQMSVQ
jgi:hypothetical protein